jgi:hypothetical protein
VYVVGGGSAVLMGWRETSVDADLYSDRDEVFREIQDIKEQLDVNVEFARPEQFVPALPGADKRHVLIRTTGSVEFYHYDPYSQVFSKLVRGFERDLADARHFVEAGLVEAEQLRALIASIPKSAYAKYPNLSAKAVQQAVELFLNRL